MEARKTDTIYRVDPWVIRRARATDATALYNYFTLIADERPNNTVVRRALMEITPESMHAMIERYERDNGSAFFVAVCADEMIGSVRLTSGSSAFDAHMVELSINVHPDWRGCGLGSSLLRTGISWARVQPQITRIQLEALTRNPAAMKLYARHGFVVEGIDRNAYRMVDEGDGQQMVDAARMALHILRRQGTPLARSEEFSAWDDQWG